jgi:hypothetical protein
MPNAVVHSTKAPCEGQHSGDHININFTFMHKNFKINAKKYVMACRTNCTTSYKILINYQSILETYKIMIECDAVSFIQTS